MFGPDRTTKKSISKPVKINSTSSDLEITDCTQPDVKAIASWSEKTDKITKKISDAHKQLENALGEFKKIPNEEQPFFGNPEPKQIDYIPLPGIIGSKRPAKASGPL